MKFWIKNLKIQINSQKKKKQRKKGEENTLI